MPIDSQILRNVVAHNVFIVALDEFLELGESEML